jgi:hypothetical protein
MRAGWIAAWMTWVVALVVAVPAAFADDGPWKLPNVQVSPLWYFQDVRAGTPSGGSTVAAIDGAVLGLGLEFNYRPKAGSNWSWVTQGGYGIGSEKQEISVGGPTFTNKVTFKNWDLSSGFKYELPVSKSASIYATGGLFYSSTIGTYENATLKQDSEPFKTFGIDKSFGASLNVGSRYGLWCEQYSTYGWGSVKAGSAKFSETWKAGCYRAGLSIAV